MKLSVVVMRCDGWVHAGNATWHAKLEWDSRVGCAAKEQRGTHTAGLRVPSTKAERSIDGWEP